MKKIIVYAIAAFFAVEEGKGMEKVNNHTEQNSSTQRMRGLFASVSLSPVKARCVESAIKPKIYEVDGKVIRNIDDPQDILTFLPIKISDDESPLSEFESKELKLTVE